MNRFLALLTTGQKRNDMRLRLVTVTEVGGIKSYTHLRIIEYTEIVRERMQMHLEHL